MTDQEKPLIERYRMVVGMLWIQTENLDKMTRSMVTLLDMVPDRRRTRQFKLEIQELIDQAMEKNDAFRQGVQELAASAQEEA